MSLQPQPPLPPAPDDTARIARAAFRRGNPYVPCATGSERCSPTPTSPISTCLYPALGQPAYAPWRLALVTLMQFREGLSDRQAADAVRGRIDWKCLPALGLTDAGFDHSISCEFRGRLLQHGAGERLRGRLLDAARGSGLLKPRGRRRTDSTHVLAAGRDLNRVELLAETLRASLNEVAVAAPDRLRALAPPAWYGRHGRRIEDMRLPETGPKRDASVAQVGADGYRLLDALAASDVPTDLPTLPSVAALGRVWARHFERITPEPGTGRVLHPGWRVRPRRRPRQGRRAPPRRRGRRAAALERGAERDGRDHADAARQAVREHRRARPHGPAGGAPGTTRAPWPRRTSPAGSG